MRIDADQAWVMLKSADSIQVAKGKKVARFEQVPREKEAVLLAAMGPSGNLRAPTYRTGNSFVIGFNPELYENWIK